MDSITRIDIREFCDDDESVLPLCENTGVEFTLCEKSDYATESANRVKFDSSLKGQQICDASFVEKDVACYPKTTTSCDATGCEVVEQTICDPKNPDSCQVVCSDPSDEDSCVEVCPGGYDCYTVDAYRGTCDCTSGAGVECGSKRVIDSVDTGSCTDAVKCTDGVGCVYNDDSCECTAAGGCDSSCGDFYTEEVAESSKLVCKETLDCNKDYSEYSAQNVKCVGDTTAHGGMLLVNSSAHDDLLRASDKENKTDQGDNLCPEGYEYDADQNHCQKKTTICDFGSGDDLTCDDLTQGTDYWSLYTDSCVSSVSSPALTYDTACCYESTFNDMDIYENEGTTVKVY